MPLFDALREKLGCESFTLLSADDFLKRGTNNFDLNLPLVITGFEDKEAETHAKLENLFGGEIQKCEGYIIAKAPRFFDRKVYSYGDLTEIIRRLRDDDGCPWDRAQTNLTLRQNAIEEAYELVEAIELGDDEKILEESGDVLLQGLFNAIIAESEGRFTESDMISTLCTKLVTRHTHIFGENKASNSEEALKFWELAKAKEKKQDSVSDKLNSVPKTFGSVMRANKVQKILHKVGFDFASAEDSAYKVTEELNELLEAPLEKKEEEAGDLIFAAVNIARLYGIDPEIALTRTIKKFIKRFEYVEKKAVEAGKKVSDCTLDEMESWYNEYKLFNR